MTPAHATHPAGALVESQLRRLLAVWGFVPGFTVPHEDVTLTTRDGVRLAGTYLPTRAPAGSSLPADVPAVVLAHGFAGHRRKPAYVRLAEHLVGDSHSPPLAVLTIDLRGHGASAGRCALGATEVHDLRAAAAWLRRAGHGFVAVVAASMGGTAALRAAGSGTAGVFDAVCTISAPARWGNAHGSPHLAVLGRVATVGWYRALVGAALRVRIDGWHSGGVDPLPPVAVAARIAPTPLLLVHAVDDHYFGVEQAEALHAAAGANATLWREAAGAGHAEDLFTPEFCARLQTAVLQVRATGAWPASEPATAARECSP